MQRSVFIILFLIIATACRSQFLDSLNVVFHSKSSIDARFESRYSFIQNQLISVTGVRLGVAFNRKLRIGGGVSWLKSDVPKTFCQTNDLGKTDPITKYLKFGYLCYYIDFVYYKTQRWQLSVPIQAGAGWLGIKKKQIIVLILRIKNISFYCMNQVLLFNSKFLDTLVWAVMWLIVLFLKTQKK